MQKIETILTPALFPFRTMNDTHICVVNDILRATTSICTAISNGAKAIIPVRTIEQAEVIAYALESCNIQNTKEVVMIGDRKHDVLGAKAMGLDSIGVLYGYGSREELEAAGADRIVESAEDLIRILE